MTGRKVGLGTTGRTIERTDDRVDGDDMEYDRGTREDDPDDWDISTHPESAPVNGPSGKAKDGIHKLDAYSKTK